MNATKDNQEAAADILDHWNLYPEVKITCLMLPRDEFPIRYIATIKPTGETIKRNRAQPLSIEEVLEFINEITGRLALSFTIAQAERISD
jgi:hypothetical protein